MFHYQHSALLNIVLYPPPFPPPCIGAATGPDISGYWRPSTDGISNQSRRLALLVGSIVVREREFKKPLRSIT